MLELEQSGKCTPQYTVSENFTISYFSDAPDVPRLIEVDVENVPALVFIQPCVVPSLKSKVVREQLFVVPLPFRQRP